MRPARQMPDREERPGQDVVPSWASSTRLPTPAWRGNGSSRVTRASPGSRCDRNRQWEQQPARQGAPDDHRASRRPRRGPDRDRGTPGRRPGPVDAEAAGRVQRRDTSHRRQQTAGSRRAGTEATAAGSATSWCGPRALPCCATPWSPSTVSPAQSGALSPARSSASAPNQRLHPSPATIEVATAAKNRELLLGPREAQRVGNWFQGQLNRPGPGGIQPARSHDRKIRNNRFVHAAPGSTSIAGLAFPDEPDERT
jgi:hypothetical protein